MFNLEFIFMLLEIYKLELHVILLILDNPEIYKLLLIKLLFNTVFFNIVKLELIKIVFWNIDLLLT